MAVKSAFLDVDPNLLERNLLLDECKSNLDDYKALFGLSDQSDTPWKLVTPSPVFCVKTFDQNHKKVFVNFCTINEIPEPKDISEEDLLQIIESEDASEFRMPLSLQEPHEELDKSGKPAVCYDVAVNPKFFEKVEKSPAFKLFLVQVTFDGLKDKYDVDLNVDGHIILKNKKCVGTLRPHRIRTSPTPLQPKKQLIEEVTSPIKVKASPAKEKVKWNLNFEFVKVDSEEKGKYLYGQIHLPKVLSPSDINLEIGGDRIVVECRKAEHLLDVFFPLNLNQEDAYSEFATNTRLLHVWIPYL